MIPIGRTHQIKEAADGRDIRPRHARNRARLIKHLDEIGISEHAWCKKLGRGHSLSRMRRRLQLLKPGACQRYLQNRWQVGDNGVFRFEFAVFLAKDTSENTTIARRLRALCALTEPSIPNRWTSLQGMARRRRARSRRSRTSSSRRPLLGIETHQRP